MVVAIGLEALNGVVDLKIILIDYLPQQVITIRHLLQARVEAWLSIGRRTHLLKPCVLSDDSNSRSFLRVCVKNFSEHIAAIVRNEFRYLIVCAQNFLVELRGLRILEWQIPANHCVQYDS